MEDEKAHLFVELQSRDDLIQVIDKIIAVKTFMCMQTGWSQREGRGGVGTKQCNMTEVKTHNAIL